jgi:hypothetical protein
MHPADAKNSAADAVGFHGDGKKPPRVKLALAWHKKS